MIKSILVPLDGSPVAEAVLPHVEGLARQLGASVDFLQVIYVQPAVVAVEPPTGPVFVPIAPEDVEGEWRATENYLGRLADDWRARGIDAKWTVLAGAPAVGIVEFAHTQSIELIAMSTHGRSGLSRLVFGSVAEQVVREAGVPVLLVKPKTS